MAGPLRGYSPIMPTAFDDDGEVDLVSMRRLANFLVENGAHGMSPNGGDSECRTLKAEERKRVTEVVVEEVAGRLPVLVGTSTESTEESVDLTRHAEKAGADAVFVMPPFGQPDITDDEMHAHYAAVCSSVQLPVMIHATANMAPSFIERLQEKLPNVKYIKEETDPGQKISAYLEALGDRITVFGPGVSLMVELERGISGYMPTTCEPRIYAGIFDLWQAGDREGARREWHRLLPLIHWHLRAGSQEGRKEYLKHMGVFRTTYCRSTEGRRVLDDYDREEMREILATMEDPTAPIR